MSEENVEIVRQVLHLVRTSNWTADAGFEQDAILAAAKLFHPDFELDTTRAPMVDLRGRFRGLDDVVNFWRRWLEAWDSIAFDEKLTDAGEHVFVEFKHQTMRGRSSGLEVEFPHYWQVFTLREGRVIRQALFVDEAEALEAAELSE